MAVNVCRLQKTEINHNKLYTVQSTLPQTSEDWVKHKGGSFDNKTDIIDYCKVKCKVASR